MSKKINTSRKKIGLALGSGGWRGLSHIGVIKILRKNNIPIDVITGTSVGAVVGGMYATLGDIEKIEKIAQNLRNRDLFPAFSDLPSRSGLVRGQKALELIEKYVGRVKIEELQIQYAAVSTDLNSGKAVAIRKGSLAKAMRASSSIPFLLSPARVGKKRLVDGALSMPVPVKAAQDMGADVVIAVNLYGDVISKKTKSAKKGISGINVARLSVYYALHNLAERDVDRADVVVTPKLDEIGFGLLKKIEKNESIIKEGEIATKKQLPNLLEKLNE